MSLTYEQALALRNKHSAHVRAYELRLNGLVRGVVQWWHKPEIREDYYRSLVAMVGSNEADELITDYTTY